MAQEVTPATTHYKRLIVCCDGTGQSSSTGHAKVPTNVFRFAQALKTSVPMGGTPDEPYWEIPQVVLYQTGIGADGTGLTVVSESIAQAIGAGIDTHILEAYTFLATNYEAGDEIFLFGFSRGAFTARAIGSLISNAGLLQKDSVLWLPTIYDEYKSRRDTQEKRASFDKFVSDGLKDKNFKLHTGVVIRIMGLWDTVGSLGVPETTLTSGLKKFGLLHDMNESYGYHDTSLPTPKDPNGWRAVVVAAYQALALEETRFSFSPTLLRLPFATDDEKLFGNDTGFVQCWFPGVHTDVGGGYERAYRDISDISLAWMVDMCGALTFREDFAKILEETTLAPKRPKDQKVPKDLGWGLSETHDEFHTWTFRLAGEDIRKPGQYFLDQKKKYDENGREFETREYMHPSVRMRWQKPDAKGNQWRPASLKGFEPKKNSNGYWEWVKKLDDGKILTIPEEQIGQLQESMLKKADSEFLGIPRYDDPQPET